MSALERCATAASSPRISCRCHAITAAATMATTAPADFHIAMRVYNSTTPASVATPDQHCYSRRDQRQPASVLDTSAPTPDPGSWSAAPILVASKTSARRLEPRDRRFAGPGARPGPVRSGELHKARRGSVVCVVGLSRLNTAGGTANLGCMCRCVLLVGNSALSRPLAVGGRETSGSRQDARLQRLIQRAKRCSGRPNGSVTQL